MSEQRRIVTCEGIGGVHEHAQMEGDQDMESWDVHSTPE